MLPSSDCIVERRSCPKRTRRSPISHIYVCVTVANLQRPRSAPTLATVQATVQGAGLAVVQPEQELRPWLETRRTLKLRQRRSAAWPTLVALMLLLTTGFATAWWLSSRVAVDLAGVGSLPYEMGFARSTAAPHPMVGYVGDLNRKERSGASCESTACITSQ